MTVLPASDTDARTRWERQRDADDPFGSGSYVDALAAAGVEIAFFVQDGPPAALLATASRGPFRRAFVPPLTPYTPLSLGSDVGASLGALGEKLSAAYDDVLITLPPEIADARPLQWAGWTVEPRYTYRLDTARAADPASWSENPRRTLRRHGDAFRIEEDARQAGEVARLCSDAYARHRRKAPLSPPMMTALARRVAESGSARTLVAVDQGDVVRAGVVLLAGRGVWHYWMAGSEPGPAMTVLLASVIERLAEADGPLLDLVGANTESIAEFKRRFGPELVQYHLARITPNRVLRLLDTARSTLAR